MTAVSSLLAPSPSSVLATGKPAKAAADGFALILAGVASVDVTTATGTATAGGTGTPAASAGPTDQQQDNAIDPATLLPAVPGEPEPSLAIPTVTVPGDAPAIPPSPPIDRHDDAADGKPLPASDPISVLRTTLPDSATPAPKHQTGDDPTPDAHADASADDDEKSTPASPPIVGIDPTAVPPLLPIVIPPADAVPLAHPAKTSASASPLPVPITDAVPRDAAAGPPPAISPMPSPPAVTTISASPTVAPGQIVDGAALQALTASDARSTTAPAIVPTTAAPPSGGMTILSKGGEPGQLPVPPTLVPPTIASAPKDGEPIRPAAFVIVNGAPAATPAAPSLAPPTTASPIAIGATAPAGQTFAAAIEAADRQDRLAADRGMDASAAAATTAAGTMPVAAAGGTGTDQPSLDMRQQGWPAAMVDHIEKLRDTADATSTRIRVVPDALGSIDVTVHRHDDGAVQVSLAADRPATQALIADARPELTRLAGERGTRLDVSVGGGSGTGGNTFGAGSGAPDGRAQPQATQRRAPAPATTPSDDPDDPADPAERRVA